MTDYYYKYAKYKSKYRSLKANNEIDNSSNESIADYSQDDNLIGGAKKIVIHISGPSGAGKTTLGNKLTYKYGDKIVVKDIDDLRFDFVKKEYRGFTNFKFNKEDNWNAEKYQVFINKFINKNNKKPLVFVGLNHMPWWNKTLYYDMHPHNKFYIKLNTDIIFKQKCGRFIDDEFIKNKEQLFKDIIKDEKTTIKQITNGFKNECSYLQIKTMNEMWNKDYKLQGYKYLTREKIFDYVCVILDDIL